MKTFINIQITEKSLNEAGLDRRKILDESLEILSALYDRYNLDFDCGYNPQMITNGFRN